MTKDNEKNYYFTSKTDYHIKKFLEEENEEKKHEIFTNNIKPAFEKLIENLICVYNFHAIDDDDTLKRDCLANLYEMIPKYNFDKGTKCFSYFNVIAKNWFIQKARERTKKNTTESDIYCGLDSGHAKNDPNFSVSPFEDMLIDKEFWVNLYDEMDSWRDKLIKSSEKNVLESVIFLIRNPHFVSIYNKKAIYLYLREMTGLNTKQIVVNLKKMKSLYCRWKESFLHGDK